MKTRLRLNHIVLNVRDMVAMRAFFTDVLGCELVNQDPEETDDPDMVFFSLGEEHHDFALVKSSQEMRVDKGQIHHIALEVENRYRLFETLAELIEQNVEIVAGPQVHGIEGGGDFIAGDSGHVSFYIKGPEINVEIFTQSSQRPADYQYPPPWSDTIRKFIKDQQSTAVAAD